EPQRSIGIVGIDIGMGSLRRLAECRPQALGVITRKCSEQIVQRPHGGTRDYLPLGSAPAAELPIDDAIANQKYRGGKMMLLWQKRDMVNLVNMRFLCVHAVHAI